MASAPLFQANEPDEYYATVSTELLAAVPEFVTVFDVDDPEDIYMVVGEFSRFLIASHTNPPLFQKCMDFINRSFQLGGQETQDMLWIQVFESVDDHKEVLPQFASHLSPYARTLFEAYQEAWLETRNRFLKQGQ
jgi:hypothetical protein